MLSVAQATSSGETLSTLGFGARVAEITLGRAKACTESGDVFGAREGMRKCVLNPEAPVISL